MTGCYQNRDILCVPKAKVHSIMAVINENKWKYTSTPTQTVGVNVVLVNCPQKLQVKVREVQSRELQIMNCGHRWKLLQKILVWEDKLDWHWCFKKKKHFEKYKEARNASQGMTLKWRSLFRMSKSYRNSHFLSYWAPQDTDSAARWGGLLSAFSGLYSQHQSWVCNQQLH